MKMNRKLKLMIVVTAALGSQVAGVVSCGPMTLDASMKPKETLVGEVLDKYHVNFSEISFYDEPPGKLRAIMFASPQGKFRVVIDYNPKLFSADGIWPEKLIRSARCIKIEKMPN